MSSLLMLGLLVFGSFALSGCQSPSDTDETLDVDDFVDSSVTPDPASAQVAGDRTYRVVRGNNQPDDILAYDWKSSFAVTLTINGNALDDDIDLEFPVEITSATVKIQQASGGIVTPPTGGDTEHYESVITQSTTNKFNAANSSATMNFDVWYDLPSLKSEALATVTISFKDDDGQTFSKEVTVRIN
jgi:hypothetical protein